LFRAYLDRTLIQYDIALRVRMESDSVEAIKSFVAVGLGASFLPASAVAAELVEGSMVAVEVIGLPHLRRQTAAVYRTTGHLNAAAQGFLRSCPLFPLREATMSVLRYCCNEAPIRELPRKRSY